MNLLSENILGCYGDDIVDVFNEKVYIIFMMLDVMEYIFLFFVNYVFIKILEVFFDIFEDILNCDIMIEFFGEER